MLVLRHKKCGGGRIFQDPWTDSYKYIDLACIICGSRWHIHKSKNALGRAIIKSNAA